MKNKPLISIIKNTPSVKAYVKAIKGNQHVTPKWDEFQVKKSGTSRATKIFSTQKEAIQFARKIALNQQSELFIHGKNGKIRNRVSYSFPPR